MGQGQITAGQQGAAELSSELASAHKALRADPAIQFNLTPVEPPPQPPSWLKDFIDWLGKTLKPVFDWIGSILPDAPVARFLFWSLIALAVAALLWIIIDRLRHGEWRLPWRRRVALAETEADEEWRPEAAPARSWLEEADALAAQGRFAEAVHHLLIRSIEDIAARRPKLVRPALTSRELAAADAIPSPARALFAHIAQLVERSLFGGRSVAEGDWQEARTAYADFALPQAWRA